MALYSFSSAIQIFSEASYPNKFKHILRLATKYPMAHYSLYLKLLLYIHFNWWRLLYQPIIPKLPKKIHIKDWVNLS